MASNDQRIKEQLATNMLLPIDEPQRNLMQQRPPPLLPCQQQPQLLKPQDQYLISTNRQSCYLCETPRASYALISSVYSEVVCRSCVNYEGPDKVEFTIRQARRLKIQSSQLPMHPTCITTAPPVSAFMSKFSPIISQPPPIQHTHTAQQSTNHQHQQRLHHQQYLQTQPLHYQNQPPQHNISEDPHVILHSKGRSTIPCSNNKNSIFNINQHPISPKTQLNVPSQVIVAPKLALGPESTPIKQSSSSNIAHQSKNLSEQMPSLNRPIADCSIINGEFTKELNSGYEKSDSQQRSSIYKQRQLYKECDNAQIKAQKSKISNNNQSAKLLQAHKYHEQQKRHLEQDITTNETLNNKINDDNCNEDDNPQNQLSTTNLESLASKSKFETNELSAKRSNPQSPSGSQSSETTNSLSIDEFNQNNSILSKSSSQTNVKPSSSIPDEKQTNLSQSVLLQRIKAYDSAIAQALSMRQVFYQQHLNRSSQEEATAIPSRNSEYQNRNSTLLDKRYVDEHSLSKRIQHENKTRELSKNQANASCKSNELDNPTQSAYMSASALASIDKKTLSAHKSTCTVPGVSNNLSTVSDILLKHDSRNNLEDSSITNGASKHETCTKAAYIAQIQASRYTTSGNQQGSNSSAVSKQKLLMTATINTFSSNKANDKTMSESSNGLDEHESNNLWQANNNRPYKRLKQNKLNTVGDECLKLASRSTKHNEEKSIQSKQPDKQLSAKVLGEINGVDLKNCDGEKKSSKSASDILNPTTLSKSPQIHITVASSKTLSDALSTTATSMTTTTVTDSLPTSMRNTLHANSPIVSKSICNLSTPTPLSYRGSSNNAKSFLISNNLLDTSSSNNRCKMMKSDELKCCQCHEIMENKHFVQCPSVAKHKFCFGCSKKSIEEQRAEYIRQHQQNANSTNTTTKSSSSSNNLTNAHSNNDYEKLFCPSGKKCFLANERSPWTFMNNEIETIFRESNRYSDGEKCSMMKNTDNTDSYMQDELCVSVKTNKRSENMTERAIEMNQISTDTSESKLTI